ncbi:hypothetical protein OC834_007948, partial [Tilletia horrida]
RSAIRISTLALNHTLLRRASAFGIEEGASPARRHNAQRPMLLLDSSDAAKTKKRRFSTRLTALAGRCPPAIEREHWLREPWWTPVGRLERVEVVPRAALPADKDAAGEVIRAEVLERWEEIRVFTDGSRQKDGRTGVGLVMYRGDREVEVRAHYTGTTMEVYDAE